MPWLTQDAVDFLAELELKNDRDWAGPQVWTTVVRSPAGAGAGHDRPVYKLGSVEVDLVKIGR